ncbi:hypothetical protein STRTUCAR8_04848, partial [Streptomyces turgidiscabies Car8]
MNWCRAGRSSAQARVFSPPGTLPPQA